MIATIPTPHWRKQGILFFAYGMDESTMKHFMEEAFTSARRIKALNPSVNISLVTNPDLHPDMTGAFDMVRLLVIALSSCIP